MPVSKVGQRRQVVIPKAICEDLGLKEGDFVEIKKVKESVVIKPKTLVDLGDVLTPEEEKIVRQGESQVRRGEVLDWEQVKKELKL